MLPLIIAAFRLYAAVNQEKYPRIIWMYFDRELPDSISAMVSITNTTLRSHWAITMVDSNNLFNFLPPSIFPPHFSALVPAHKSDFIRVKLLERYGGWWLDSTLVVSSLVWFESIYSTIVTSSSQFFGVCHHMCPSSRHVETSFLFAPLNSTVLRYWSNEIDKLHTIGTENYMYNAYRGGVTFTDHAFQPYPMVYPYLDIFVSFQVVLQRLIPRHLPLTLLRGRDTIYKINFDCHYNVKCMREKILTELNNPGSTRYPFMKINTWLRKSIWKDSTNHSMKVVETVHPLIVGHMLCNKQLIAYRCNMYFSAFFAQLLIVTAAMCRF